MSAPLLFPNRCGSSVWPSFQVRRRACTTCLRFLAAFICLRACLCLTSFSEVRSNSCWPSRLRYASPLGCQTVSKTLGFLRSRSPGPQAFSFCFSAVGPTALPPYPPCPSLGALPLAAPTSLGAGLGGVLTSRTDQVDVPTIPRWLDGGRGTAARARRGGRAGGLPPLQSMAQLPAAAERLAALQDGKDRSGVSVTAQIGGVVSQLERGRWYICNRIHQLVGKPILGLG
eukprot:GHVT01094889.1.p2 GENE.GHVT01094889.1~~GHVT01094889.1.p2  ORF type:complete len:229 (+),score=22.23 GHVT01094889.1:438-1124(+)